MTCDSAQENPDFLFDNSLNTVFTSKGQELNIQYSFKGNEPYVINKYTINLADDSAFNPANWSLYGSKNNKNWIEISNINSPGFNIRNKTYTYFVTGSKNFKYYKYIFKVKNDSCIQLKDIQLFGYKYIGSPQIWAINENSSDFSAINAFDNNTNTIWATDLQKGWITYNFKTPMVLKKYQVLFAGTLKSSPEKLTLWASNDCTEWSLLSSEREIKMNDKNRYAFDISWNTEKFIFYKLELENKEPIQISEIKYTK